MKLILLITGLAMTNLMAQTFVPPPPPPIPAPIGMSTNSTYTAPQRIPRLSRFKVTCPYCSTAYAKLPATMIQTNGSASTNGGFIVQRTLTFDCVMAKCGLAFTAQNTTFAPLVIAVDADEAAPLPGAPAPTGGGASVTPTWTTDPNLILTIQYTNFTNAIPWPVTAMIPSGAGTFHSWWSNGVQVITNSNQFVWTTNSVAISVICGPAVMLKYPTVIGKTYKCQASDDNRAPGDPLKVWMDGNPVAGTGGFIVNYEAATKPVRAYRVVRTI